MDHAIHGGRPGKIKETNLQVKNALKKVDGGLLPSKKGKNDNFT